MVLSDLPVAAKATEPVRLEGDSSTSPVSGWIKATPVLALRATIRKFPPAE
jgi:hypothetical protein